MFGDIIQPTHLLFILVVALIVLGPKRLPEVGRSLGRGLRDFRSAMSGIEEHANGLLRDDPTPASPPAPTVVPPTFEPQAPTFEPQAATVEPQPAPAVPAPLTVARPQPVATGVPDPDPGDYAD